jgi:hypothetical protein
MHVTIPKENAPNGSKLKFVGVIRAKIRPVGTPKNTKTRVIGGGT